MEEKKVLLDQEVALAKEVLLNHGVVAFPTETVMGLGVIFDDELAYNKLNKVKERPEDKPYTLMLKSKDEINKYAVINDATQRVIDAFVPGSITILVPVKEHMVASYVTHSTGIIGMRVPTNMGALALLNAVGKPLLVPSANKSGKKPALNSQEVIEIFGDEIDCVISGEAKGEVPSTIVDLTGDIPVLIRKGPIPFETIMDVYMNK